MRYCTTAEARQYQNTVNNAQGHLFEDSIIAACKTYAQNGQAAIDKTPEPFRVTKKYKNGEFTGRFTSPAQPDFQGTLKGGKSIVFEAKYTTTDRLKQDILTVRQAETLDYHHSLGAITAICAGIGQAYYFIPWTVWRDMKSIFGRKHLKPQDIEKYRVHYAMGIMFLDNFITYKVEFK